MTDLPLSSRRPTSRDAYAAILPKLSKVRQEVALHVLDMPGRTALELEQWANKRHLNKRLSELERMGVIVAGAPRHCKISGRNAVTWWPSENPTLKPLEVRRIPRKRLEAVYAAAVEAFQAADVSRLKAVMG